MAEREYEFEVWQDGSMVAGASSPDRQRAMNDACHYIAVYSQDGPVELYEVTRTLLHAQPQSLLDEFSNEELSEWDGSQEPRVLAGKTTGEA